MAAVAIPIHLMSGATSVVEILPDTTVKKLKQLLKAGLGWGPSCWLVGCHELLDFYEGFRGISMSTTSNIPPLLVFGIRCIVCIYSIYIYIHCICVPRGWAFHSRHDVCLAAESKDCLFIDQAKCVFSELGVDRTTVLAPAVGLSSFPR